MPQVVSFLASGLLMNVVGWLSSFLSIGLADECSMLAFKKQVRKSVFNFLFFSLALIRSGISFYFLQHSFSVRWLPFSCRIAPQLFSSSAVILRFLFF